MTPSQESALSKLAVDAEPCPSNASRAPKGARPEAQEIASSMPRKERQLLEQQSVDTEAGMLSGISQKHNMRSSPCRFTEFCNSQCLSHFAAPFIVDRTETSIAESCKLIDVTQKSHRHRCERNEEQICFAARTGSENESEDVPKLAPPPLSA